MANAILNFHFDYLTTSLSLGITCMRDFRSDSFLFISIILWLPLGRWSLLYWDFLRMLMLLNTCCPERWKNINWFDRVLGLCVHFCLRHLGLGSCLILYIAAQSSEKILTNLTVFWGFVLICVCVISNWVLALSYILLPREVKKY